MMGQTFSHYEITEKLDEGGMGVLYRARDTHLDRVVAIKVLRPEAVGSEERRQRFVREAKAASALNHPNIITIYDIDRLPEGDQDFIAMEYVEGKALGESIPSQGLPIEKALGYAVQIVDALGAAHEAGIVHRDIKPANIMVTGTGRIKVLDFGLAKLVEHDVVDTTAPTRTRTPRTEEGAVLGTPSYMSPEQAAGDRVDTRSDVFSLGCVLYEMLTGNQPFRGDSHVSIIKAILQESPAPLASVRPDMPPDVERVVSRCLEKKPESRYASAGELLKDLSECQSRLAAGGIDLRAVLRQPRFAVPGVMILTALITLVGWWGVRTSRVRWARNTALPEIARLADEEDIAGALLLAKQARRYIPDDRRLQELWGDLAAPVSIVTTPPGADVYLKAYSAVDSHWQYLGKSPIEDSEMPNAAYLRWKFSKEGYETLELGAYPFNVDVFTVQLEPEGTAPAGMIRVPGGEFRLFNAPAAELEEYWLDKYEVTNWKYQEFVDAGGYEEQKYWKHPFIKDGEALSWEQGTAEFRDATGRPGPSTWVGGTYPERQGEFPVSGVSWYEAAAYADFVGKSLPTIYHWYYASGGTGTDSSWVSDILYLSNFGSDGPTPVGSRPGMAPYGSYDMAGNVKEWCWNQADEERRYLLGGAWNEPRYMFREPDAHSPFDRDPAYGFRLAKYQNPLLEEGSGVDAPVVVRACPFASLFRDYSKEKPVADEVFDHFRSLYAYDRTDLHPLVESIDDGYEQWRKETVSFDAAYADERVIGYLFLPRNAAPPYQTVVYFPEVDALYMKSSRSLWLRAVNYIIRSGRAVMYPVYQGTYERQGGFQRRGPRSFRDVNIHWSQDLCRSIDYLQTREDIDSERLAFFGLSLGANRAPILNAIERRFKAAILLAGGFSPRSVTFPETDPLNFAPRARAPLLMLNGRDDFAFPLQSCQIPLFRLWGAPGENKRHVVFESGHIPPRNQFIKEVLDWLDRYLGPVDVQR